MWLNMTVLTSRKFTDHLVPAGPFSYTNSFRVFILIKNGTVFR
jgi:hypothetical protein